MSAHGITTMKKHDQFYLRDGNICFLVEDTVFRLHRHFFERESDYFSERLTPLTESEDGSPNHPYIISDVKPEEFAQFVWVWYNPRYSYSKQDKQTWLTILRLATMWRFPGMRDLAVRHLEKLKLEPIEKITMYKQYSVDHELLLPSYVSLCKSPTLPSPAEGKILSMETVLRLAHARESLLFAASEQGHKTPTTACVPDDLVNSLVAQLFDLTLQSNDHGVRLRGQTTNNGNAAGDGSDTSLIVKQPNPKKVKSGAPQDLQNGPSQNGVTGTNKGKSTK